MQSRREGFHGLGADGIAGGLIGSGRVARLIGRVADGRLRPLGVAAGQIPVFAALHDGSEMSQTVLARLARIEQPTMAATLVRMECDDLIGRRPDPADKRSSLVRLTPKALALAPRVMATLQGAREEMLAGFDPTERRHLVEVLHPIIVNLEVAERRDEPTTDPPPDRERSTG